MAMIINQNSSSFFFVFFPLTFLAIPSLHFFLHGWCGSGPRWSPSEFFCRSHCSPKPLVSNVNQEVRSSSRSPKTLPLLNSFSCSLDAFPKLAIWHPMNLTPNIQGQIEGPDSVLIKHHHTLAPYLIHRASLFSPRHPHLANKAKKKNTQVDHVNIAIL